MLIEFDPPYLSLSEEKAVDENLVIRQEDVLVAESSEKSGEGGLIARRGNFTGNGIDSILSSQSNSSLSKGCEGSIEMSGSAIESDSRSDSDSDNGLESIDKDGEGLSDIDEDGSASSSSDDHHSQDADKESSNENTAPNDDPSLPKQERMKSKDGKKDDNIEKLVTEHTMPSFETDAILTEAALTEAVRSSQVLEKREVSGIDQVNLPLVYSPDNESRVFGRLRNGGIEVLKLNREKNWQPRFLTITAETMRLGKFDSFPAGLLWVKKFDQGKQPSLASIDKNGKGGILFYWIDRISVTKDNHALNRKQKKGKFKDSITLVLHSNKYGSLREIRFRCLSNEDGFALSSGIQSILDCIRLNKKSNKGQLKVITSGSMMEPTPIESNDRWEL